jgi:hypothetical protein
MNRTLKFRIWSKRVNQYIDIDTGNYDFSLNELFYELQKNSVIQQYTGLKDYESNDIYEGDIVRYELDGTVYTQTVGWGNNGWEMIDTRLYSTPLITNLPNFEVIGNIFESRELLNK